MNGTQLMNLEAYDLVWLFRPWVWTREGTRYKSDVDSGGGPGCWVKARWEEGLSPAHLLQVVRRVTLRVSNLSGSGRLTSEKSLLSVSAHGRNLVVSLSDALSDPHPLRWFCLLNISRIYSRILVSTTATISFWASSHLACY